MRNYYEILNIARDASSQEIEDAFRAIVREANSKGTDGRGFLDRVFLEAQEAYSILSNRQKKTNYDREFEQYMRGLATKSSQNADDKLPDEAEVQAVIDDKLPENESLETDGSFYSKRIGNNAEKYDAKTAGGKTNKSEEYYNKIIKERDDKILSLVDDIDTITDKHKKNVRVFSLVFAVLFFGAIFAGFQFGKKSNYSDNSDSVAVNESAHPEVSENINLDDSIRYMNEKLNRLRDENEKLKKPAPATANPATINPRTPGNSQSAPATRVTNGNNADDISSLNLEQLVRKYYASGTSRNTKTEIAKKIQKDRGLKDLQATYTLIENLKLALEIDD